MYTSVTPSVSFIRGSSFLIQAERRSQLPDIESPLSKPLISATNSDREIVIPTSIPPITLSSASVFGASISDLPPPQQCSYSQSLLNGNLFDVVLRVFGLNHSSVFPDVCSHQCFVWNWDSINSFCTERGRVDWDLASVSLWNHCLLYRDLVEAMFRKLVSTTNLSGYRAGCFWIRW